MVAGQDLLQLVCRLVEDDEVLHQIHEVALVADALEQRLHVDRARLLLGEALPCVEVLPAAGDRADLRLLAVAEHHYRIVVEEMGNGVAVVRVVLLEGGLEVPVDVLALDEQQRQAVDEADDVRPPPVEAAAYPELPHAEKVIVGGFVEVEDPESLVHQLALGVTERHPNAVAHQRVLLPVGGGDALRGGGLDDLPHRVVVGGIGETRVQGHEFLAHQARQYDFAVGSAAEQAVRPEVFVCCGRRRIPSRAALPGTRRWSAGRACLRCRVTDSYGNIRRRPAATELQVVRIPPRRCAALKQQPFQSIRSCQQRFIHMVHCCVPNFRRTSDGSKNLGEHARTRGASTTHAGRDP